MDKAIERKKKALKDLPLKERESGAVKGGGIIMEHVRNGGGRPTELAPCV